MARGRKPVRLRDTIIATIIMIACVGVITWAMTSDWRDAQDLTWVRCEVVDAKPKRGGRYASVPWYVLIETADCGWIAYRVGTRENNVAGLADNISPGPYEFKFGRTSQREAAGQTLLDHTADAKDVRKLPADSDESSRG